MAMRDYILGEVTADYSEAVISRREALRRLGLLGLSAAAAGSLLAACGGGDDGGEEGERAGAPKIAPAPTTRPAPTAVEDIAFAGPRGEVLGVFAAPSKPKGAVLVIHEIFGVTDHIRSIPLRFAADGYTALAIDLLSEEGGTTVVGGDAIGVLAAASEERLVTDMQAGLDELERREPGAKIGAIGFCFGGGMAWQLLDAGERRACSCGALLRDASRQRRLLRIRSRSARGLRRARHPGERHPGCRCRGAPGSGADPRGADVRGR